LRAGIVLCCLEGVIFAEFFRHLDDRAFRSAGRPAGNPSNPDLAVPASGFAWSCDLERELRRGLDHVDRLLRGSSATRVTK
jgi:hypothetical protein